LIPECQLPGGRLRQWHYYDDAGLCECGRKRTPRANHFLAADKDAAIVSMLQQGAGIRETAREIGVSTNTVRVRALSKKVTTTATTVSVEEEKSVEVASPAPVSRLNTPTRDQLREFREAIACDLTLTDRALRAMEIVEDRLPSHYVEIARAVLDEAAAGSEIARSKVLAVLGSALFWTDAFASEFENPVVDGFSEVWEAEHNETDDDGNQVLFDPESDSIDLIGDAAETIIGKEAERSWLKPRAKAAEATA
jgi:transposase-like protein